LLVHLTVNCLARPTIKACAWAPQHASRCATENVDDTYVVRRITSSVSALIALTLAACGAPRARSVSEPRPASSPTTYQAANVPTLGGIPLDEITGTYTGDWGTMYLIFIGNEVRGAYSHENGRLVGIIDGDVIRATWCQDQAARTPTGSAEFRFT